jgi:hypothetical protein
MANAAKGEMVTLRCQVVVDGYVEAAANKSDEIFRAGRK